MTQAGNSAGIEIDIEIGCKEREIPRELDIRRWIQAALAGAGISGPVQVSVKIVDAGEMQALNRQYRDQDMATNVLSFEAGAVQGLPADEVRFLGDIAICASVVNDEAARQDKLPGEHWAHIIIHGTLHLLGFDHVTDSAAREMEALEIRILRMSGIANPYLRSI